MSFSKRNGVTYIPLSRVLQSCQLNNGCQMQHIELRQVDIPLFMRIIQCDGHKKPIKFLQFTV